MLLGHLRPDLPAVLNARMHALLQRMWHVKPEERPTAEAVLDALDALGTVPFVEQANKVGADEGAEEEEEDTRTTAAGGSSYDDGAASATGTSTFVE